MTRDATEAAMRELATRVYERDHSDPEDRASTTDFAFAFVAWLRAHGWKHTPPPSPARRPSPAPRPAAPAGLRGADLARHALAQLGKGECDGR
ncbi:hypothetical protein ACGF0J_14080 [Nonomuraea sp. NPDC047897]|uniref:hypothetical protein n=1 Tax=Nonomuraea sp. NPDC047897 TaxID=3364346 RepID=UPI00371C6E2B